MGERKVLNKYFPPDFDPAKIPRRRQPRDQQIKVRMMLPMSVRCATCGTYIYKGTKFNSRKEDVIGETYLGIQIFRFYFKCTKCSAEITMKTDPQNSDYTVESGASRNFEPWRANEEATENAKRKRDAEEMGDAMKSLENRTVDSKIDMDILAALEEMRSVKSRHATVSVESMLEILQKASEDKEQNIIEKDRVLVKSIIFHNSKDYVRQIELDDDDEFLEEGSVKQLSENDKDKVRSAKSSAIQNPTDTLVSESPLCHNKAEGKSGASVFPKPIIIVKPKDAPSNVAKKMRALPKEEDVKQNGYVEDGKERYPMHNRKDESSVARWSLQSICQNYDCSDESD